jgi:acyl carrier protein
MQLFVEYAAGREERPTLPLRLAFLGGDWIPLTLPGQIKALFNGCQVVSVGGPTETTLWNICYPIEDVDPTWRSIPYGRPMANTKYAILNEVLEDCPVWVTGMMYCAGDGLAKGYWRDEAKTRNAFIHHPRTGERLYRTGDLGRFLPDGTIEILGREDAQVKIRGHRIELGEIEHALLLSPGVKLAVVKAFGEPSGDRQLAAYIVPSGPLASPSDLRMHLQRLLPDYMLPSTFTMLQELPLTHSGKIDRKALPEPAHAVESGATSNPTREGLVNRIGMLVRQVLKAVPVAPDANLLCLGATSIDMVRISNLLERELGFRPRIDDFYRTPTVQALAAMYEAYLLGLRTGDFHSRLLAEKQPFWDELLLDPDERAAEPSHPSNSTWKRRMRRFSCDTRSAGPIGSMATRP